MCIIPGDKMAEAMRDDTLSVDVMAKTLNQIDALFAPHLARADAQSRKIAEAARLCEDDEDQEPWGTQA